MRAEQLHAWDRTNSFTTFCSLTRATWSGRTCGLLTVDCFGGGAYHWTETMKDYGGRGSTVILIHVVVYHVLYGLAKSDSTCQRILDCYDTHVKIAIFAESRNTSCLSGTICLRNRTKRQQEWWSPTCTRVSIHTDQHRCHTALGHRVRITGRPVWNCSLLLLYQIMISANLQSQKRLKTMINTVRIDTTPTIRDLETYYTVIQFYCGSSFMLHKNC